MAGEPLTRRFTHDLEPTNLSKFNFHFLKWISHGKSDVWKLIRLDKLIAISHAVVVWPIFQSIEANKKFKNTKHSEFLILLPKHTRHIYSSCNFVSKTREESENRENSRKISFSRSLRQLNVVEDFCRLFPAFFSLFTLSHVLTFHFHVNQSVAKWRRVFLVDVENSLNRYLHKIGRVFAWLFELKFAVNWIRIKISSKSMWIGKS